MRSKTRQILLAITLGISVCSIEGQTLVDDTALYRLPDEYSLSFAVLQQDMPVEFEDIAILVRKNGEAPFFFWAIKNNSKKSVSQFEVSFSIYTNVEEWKGFLGLTGYDFSSIEARPLIRPGEVYRSSGYSAENVPDEIHRMLRSDNPGDGKRFITVRAMVKKVTFDDGTVITDDDSVFRRL